MVRILVLYLLLEGALSGYDIKRILSRPYVRFWFPVEDASIYSSLKTLACRGLAEGSAHGRATRYRITRRGVEALRALTRKAWQSQQAAPFNAALAASADLSAAELGEALRGRIHILGRRRRELEGVRAGALSPLLARREAALLEAEIRWLESELEGVG